MRTIKGYSELAVGREAATITFTLAETQRQKKEWDSFTVGKMEDFMYALIGEGWPGKLWAKEKWDVLCDWLGCIFGFLGSFLNWKQGLKLGKLSVVS